MIAMRSDVRLGDKDVGGVRQLHSKIRDAFVRFARYDADLSAIYSETA